MGFKDVCMKFKIFLCSDCKSAHQAFSHRCKVRVRRRPILLFLILSGDTRANLFSDYSFLFASFAVGDHVELEQGRGDGARREE